MKSLSYFDASYSPNEANETLDIPLCLDCGDEGYTRRGVFNEHKAVCSSNCMDYTPCYFCDTPMELEKITPYRKDICMDCAKTELGS